MNSPVDLTNLHSMTDNDREMEKALFEEFYASFETGIIVLQSNTGEAASEMWRKEAHALKGIALNLGAAVLGTLCKQAQEDFRAEASTKQALVEQIDHAYRQVKQFLQSYE